VLLEAPFRLFAGEATLDVAAERASHLAAGPRVRAIQRCRAGLRDRMYLVPPFPGKLEQQTLGT
jgi:hypothetical protein